MKENFALVDCNNFYVECERVFDPKLSDRPVAVMSNNDGCVIARSNEVKALGIPMGVPVFKFKEMIIRHHIETYSTNYALYGDMSRRVMETLSRFADMEVYSIDEAFLHLTLRNNLSRYGRHIRETVRQWTGIPTTIGIGSTKTLSKVATTIAKKHRYFKGVLDVAEYSADRLLETVEVEDVWGIGRKYGEKLNRNNIFTALDLKNAPDHWIKKHLTVVGLRTVWELRGIPCIALEDAPSPKKQIICSRTFGTAVDTFDALREAVASYGSNVAEKLRRQESVASRIHVFIQTSPFAADQTYYANAFSGELPSPTAYTPEIISYASKCLKKIFKSGLKYKKAGVMVSDIRPDDGIQTDLFFSGTFDERQKVLMKTMDRINRKYGRNTIRCASSGTKHPWKMRQAKRSLRYTTRWDEIPVVK